MLQVRPSLHCTLVWFFHADLSPFYKLAVLEKNRRKFRRGVMRTSVWVGWNGFWGQTSYVFWSVAYFAFSLPLACLTKKKHWLGVHYPISWVFACICSFPLLRIKSLASWHAVCTFLCFYWLDGNDIIGTLPFKLFLKF